MENNATTKKIIDLLFPKELPNISDIEKKYPPRSLAPGAMVTRVAPSPTGFVHIGTIYATLISLHFARQTNGVFFLRIEDTDKKREVEGAIELITSSLKRYSLVADEGYDADGKEKGLYGPYKQSERAQIYQAYVKDLVSKGLAYPCFATAEELESMRAEQEALKIRPGYYKKWAKWRDRSDEEILAALEEKKPFVIRHKSMGDFEKKIPVHDLLLGKRELSENDIDTVILKSDGLPTYHMAHVIDDHLMGTTHVLRGNEWFASLALHLQLFEMMNWPAPLFGHIFPIQKMDGTSKRKLSKRKDPEANVEFYDKEGYPEDGVILYLLNLANSNFEDWKKANPDKKYQDFVLSFEKLANSSGPLFDFEKLNNINKDLISKYTAEEIFNKTLTWANKYDLELKNLMEANVEYVKNILNIERGNALKPRKDIAKWSDIRAEIEYFFDDKFSLNKDEALKLLDNLKFEDIKNIINSFQAVYDENDNRDEWFEKLKNVATAQGFAINAKEYKADPEKFKGNVADVAKIFRVLLCGRTQTPDLSSIMRVLGRERVFKRLDIIK